MDDVKGIERLSDGMDALAGLELHVLEQEFFIGNGGCGGDAQQVAQFFQVGPQFALALPAGLVGR
jgi:hypothetical protein